MISYICFVKKYFYFDNEYISGKTYALRLVVSVFLLVFIVGIWLLSSTAYKRARSLNWGESAAGVSAILIPIHFSVPLWPEFIFYSGNISIIIFPIYLLQLILLFKNGKKRVKDSKIRIIGKEFVKNLISGLQYFTKSKKRILIFIISGMLLKSILHFSIFPDNSIELDTENKKYVDGYVKEGWYYKGRNGLEPNKCIVDFDERGVKYDCMPLYVAIGYESTYNAWGAFTKNGERYRLEKGTSNLVYYYPFMNLSFMTHLSLIFESKLWIFAISYGSLFILLFMYRNKIKP